MIFFSPLNELPRLVSIIDNDNFSYYMKYAAPKFANGFPNTLLMRDES